MVGITAYSAYVPWYRISRKVISSAMGWFNPASLPGERAVANYDEDSLTMAVAAGMDCLKEFERKKLDGLYFATTTPPYKERQSAGIIATALDLSPEIRSADFTDSIKAGTTALLSACDAIEAGSIASVMLCASDCRSGRAGSSEEQVYGDGAAAFILGSDKVIASLEGSYSLSYDFSGQWKAEADRFPRIWEDRFIRDEGYSKLIPEAIRGLLKKYELSPKDFTRVAYTCPYAREHAAIGKKLGFEPRQIQEPMLTTLGDTGTAYPLMMLAAALEEAGPGDRILITSYGNGCDALVLQVTEEIKRIKDRERMKKKMAAKKDLLNYEKYAAFRNLIPVETGIRGGETAFTQLSTLWRERKTVLGLVGSRCKHCSTPQYPAQRVCVNPGCGAIDEMEEYRFSDKRAHLFTYTGDNLAFTPSPPSIYGFVDFEGGGRYWFDFTDCELDSLEVGMTMEMSFRRKYVDVARGIHGYFWKAIPVRD